MTLEEKLATIADLVSQRDAITAQLAELLGVAPQADTPSMPKPNGGRGRPKADRERVTERAHTPHPKAERGMPKPCCGSKGARHLKTCTNASGNGPLKRVIKAPLPTAPVTDDAEPLTEDQFDDLKHPQQIGDLSSKDFAENYDVSLAEVNRAITARSYTDYRNW